MKPWKIIFISAILVLAVAGIGTSIVLAQTVGSWGRSAIANMMGNGSQSGMMNSGSHTDMMGSQSHSDMMGSSGQNGNSSSWMDSMHAEMTAPGGMHSIVWKGLADTLGLTPDELSAQIKSGKTITEIAASKGISKEQLAASLESSVKAGLDKAVADGALTRAEADAMLKQMGGNYLGMLDHMSSDMSNGVGGCHNNTTPQNQSNS